MFPNENFLNVTSPLEKNDHPELDNTELCNEKQITKYMCMIGQLRMKRLHGYLAKTKHFAIRYRTKEPFSPTKQEYEWTRTVYGNVKEEIPKDIPKPLEKRLITTTFLDTNLLHDIVTGKSVTAVLHFFNTTPTDWVLKTQATIETATYGSEFIVSKTATEQTMDLRNTLGYLGVPIMTKAYMFGDNKSVVTSSTIPQSILNKRHNMKSYCRVREAIAAKSFEFHWCLTDQNRSDISWQTLGACKSQEYNKRFI